MSRADNGKPDFYKRFMYPVIVRLDPEVAHALAIWALEHDLVPPCEWADPVERIAWPIRWVIRFLNLLIGAAMLWAIVAVIRFALKWLWR